MDDSGFDEVVLPEGTQRARLMAYGPVVGEHHDAAMFGPNRNPLRPGDVAASPDYGFDQGDVVDVGDGTLRTVADWSYYHPGIPTSRTIELRNKPDQGRGYVQKVNFDEVVLPDGTKQSAPAPAGFDEVQLPEGRNATPPTDVPPGGGLSKADLAKLIASKDAPTYAPQVVTPDEQAAPALDEEHDFLFYKTGKTKSEREALNAPLREAMQVPLVSPETIGKGLQAVSEIGATSPEDLQQGPVEQGINEAVAKAISGMTTGEGATSLPLYMFPPTAVGLQAENTADLPAQVQDAIQRARQGDIKGAASTGTDALLNALMTVGVVHGGAKFMGGERVPSPLRPEPLVPEPPPTVSRGLGTLAEDVSMALQDSPERRFTLQPEPRPELAPSVPIEQTLPNIREPLPFNPEAGPIPTMPLEAAPVRTEFAETPGGIARRAELEAEKAAILGKNRPSIAIGQKLHPTTEARLAEIDQELQGGAQSAPVAAPETAPEPYTPEAAAARAAQPQPVIPPEDVKYAGGGPQTEVPGTVGISQARTEAELGPGSVVPGVGAEMGSGLAHGRDYINKGGDPRLPIRRANTSGMVGKNDVGIVHAELDRLRVERSKAAAALEANPGDPVLQQNFSLADDAQRAWRKELQPVLTKASDALREAHAASMPDADVGTYQGLADLMDEHFKGERVVTPEMRTAMAKAAKGVKETRDIANGEMAKVEGTLEKQVRARGKKVMSPEELEASIRNKLETEFADCVLGA